MKGREGIFDSHCGPATVVVSSMVTVLIAPNNHHTFSDMEIDFFFSGSQKSAWLGNVTLRSDPSLPLKPVVSPVDS